MSEKWAEWDEHIEIYTCNHMMSANITPFPHAENTMIIFLLYLRAITSWVKSVQLYKLKVGLHLLLGTKSYTYNPLFMYFWNALPVHLQEDTFHIFLSFQKKINELNPLIFTPISVCVFFFTMSVKICFLGFTISKIQIKCNDYEGVLQFYTEGMSKRLTSVFPCFKS